MCLYAREKILREDGRVDRQRYTRMTSNQFLNSVGEPSEVEALIEQIYSTGGLATAFRGIERELRPMFEKQEANRRKNTRLR